VGGEANEKYTTEISEVQCYMAFSSGLIFAGGVARWNRCGRASSALEFQTREAGVCERSEGHDGSTAPKCGETNWVLLHYFSFTGLRAPSQWEPCPSSFRYRSPLPNSQSKIMHNIV